MSFSPSDALGIERDLVALVGAGGKTTLAFAIAHESRDRRRTALVTTTTRMAAGENGGLVAVSPRVEKVAEAIGVWGACLAVGPERDGKATGVDPEWIEGLWYGGIAELVIVEADGARQQKVKAPAPHEPVIPGAATLVVACISAEAIDRIIGDVAHRPMRVASIVGTGPYERLTAERAATLLASPEGGRKSLPAGARFAVAITNTGPAEVERAGRLAGLLHPLEAVLIPRL